ncbi:MAG: GlxA family transcriptional regulator [Sneathiella sp.]
MTRNYQSGNFDILPKKIGFILIEDYALMSFSSAIEPLRAANLLAEREIYSLVFLSLHGGKVSSSVGGWFDTKSIDGAGLDFEMVFIVAGGNPFAIKSLPLERYLRRLAAKGVTLGGISGGSVVLAIAGFMNNRRFTAHWHHIDTLQEISSDYLLEKRLFVIDRDRYSCAGGIAPFDMMYAMIAGQFGADFSRNISDWFIYTGIRDKSDPQRAGLVEKYNAHHPALVAAIELMISHIADPLNLTQIAELSGVGVRQLQRLFGQYVSISAMGFYRNMRLEKADEMIRQTAAPIIEIAVATGFTNLSHFSRQFRARFQTTPNARRRNL